MTRWRTDAYEAELRGGKVMSLASFDMEAFKDPGYGDPQARLRAMDRDGVYAEVLYARCRRSARSVWSRATGNRSAERSPIAGGLRRGRSEPTRGVLSGAGNRHRLRRSRGAATRRARCSFGAPAEFPDPSSACPTITRPTTISSGRVLQETGISISHHLGNVPGSTTSSGATPRRRWAIFTSCRRWRCRGDRLVDPHRHTRTAPWSQDRVRRARAVLDSGFPRGARP